MKYNIISNASCQLDSHTIFNKINCAMFKKIVKMHEKKCENGHCGTY